MVGNTRNSYRLNDELGCVELIITACDGSEHIVLLDAEDWGKVREHVWHPNKYRHIDGGIRIYFSSGKGTDRLHRYILGLQDNDPNVVFKNDNTYDLRKQNLGFRGVNGLSSSRPGKTGISGVHYYVTSHKIVASYRKRNKKYASKSFSLNLYEYNEAIKLAKEWRDEMIKRDI